MPSSCFPCFVIFNGRSILFNPDTGTLVFAERGAAVRQFLRYSFEKGESAVIVEIADLGDLIHYMKD